MNKLITTLLIGIFMISFSSALEIDNIIKTPTIEKDVSFLVGDKLVEYSTIWEKYTPIEIVNWLGFGETLFSGAITQHTDVCGIDCSSTMQLYLANDGVLIDDVIFETLQEDGSWVEQNIRSYEFTYWGLIDDYETQCIDLKELITKNGTKYIPQECSEIKVGSHYGWVDYNLGSEVKAGTYKIKLNAQKKPSRTVDWKIITQGKTLNDWATWGSIGGGDDAEVILNSPADDYISLTNPQEFNCTFNITNGAYLENISVSTNSTGTWQENETFIYNGTLLDNPTIRSTSCIGVICSIQSTYIPTGEVLIDKTTLQLKRSGPGAAYAGMKIYYTNGTDITISANTAGDWISKTLTNPHQNEPVNKVEIGIGASGGGAVGSIKDVILLGDVISTQFLFDIILLDTTFWTCQACDSDGDCGIATENRTLLIDTGEPTINITYPTETPNYGTIGQNEIINWTVIDDNLDTCWIEYNNINTTATCLDNSTEFTLEDGVYNITFWVNDSVGNENSYFTEWDYSIIENNRTHNETSYETARETYSIYLTANSSLTKVTLDFNGTGYTAIQSGSVWSYSMDVPNSIGNKSITWNFTYAGSTIESDYTTYQNISETVFTLCNASYTDDFLNITFKDEADLSNMNASITASTFIYYLGNGNVTKTYDYFNNTDNYNYRFCATPDRTLHVDPYVQYKKNSDYPQRIWDITVQDYTDTLTTQVLYLLDSGDGIYVTLQIINNLDQLLSDVFVTATREIESIDTTVAFGTTGSPGTVTFWLNPDFSHDFLFTKTGYTTYETSFPPTQTSYTITMGGEVSVENSTIQGILYSVIPTNSYLINDTTYTFGFNLTSTYWDVDDYGFSLRLKNGTKIDGGNTATEGTDLTKDYNVANQTIIYLDYYWLIDGTYSNQTTFWIVYNTEYTQYSIASFFEHLDEYLDSGIYGLDDFGRNLIIFLILFISIGIMSYKYGATSPLAVASLMFGIVFFFDVVVGLIPTIRGIEYLPTFLTALILALAVFNEVKL